MTKFPRWNTFETWLRGAWPTNKNGVAQFTCTFPFVFPLRRGLLAEASSPRVSPGRRELLLTSLAFHTPTAIFPGYYTGRATHVHIKVHTKWEPYQNGTFKTGGIVHTGQFFVEDHINEVIDKVSLLSYWR